MTLARPGGTCSVCGVSIDRRAKTCRAHATSHLTPDHQRAAVTARWEKERTMKPVAWVPIEAQHANVRMLRADTPLGVVSLTAQGSTWDLYLTVNDPDRPDELATRQIGTLATDADKGKQSWHTYLTAPQTFRGYNDPQVPYDGDLRGDDLATWMDAVDWLLARADEVFAQSTLRPMTAKDKAPLLAPGASVSVTDRMRWAADPDGAAALFGGRSTPPAADTPEIPSFDPSIPPPMMAADEMANLIRQYGPYEIGSAIQVAGLGAAVHRGWNLVGWGFSQANGAGLFGPRNGDPKHTRVLWLNDTEHNRDKWEQVIAGYPYKVILILGKPAGAAGEDIPF